MKYAFISDIHGNADALEAVLADIEKKNIDKVCVLGDIAYRGPEPKRSIESVQNLNTEVIKGNADEWVVRGVKKGEVPEKALELMTTERAWTVSQLSKEDIDYLEKLPEEISFEQDGISFHAFHATPDSLFDVVLPTAEDSVIEEKLMQKQSADVYLYGHIHKSYIRHFNGKTIINLGSVGLPFDGIAKASYAIVEIGNGTISTSIERVSYDIEQVIRKYEQSGYPNTDMMANILRTGQV